MIDQTAIIQAVQQAALLCRQVQQRHLAHSSKGENDPVTIADYGSQALICRTISRLFPGDAVLSEEQGAQFIELVPEAQRAQVVALLSDVLGETVTQDEVVGWLDHGKDVQSERIWVIDPVDGTKGFVAMRHYAIAVGLLQNGRPVGAVIGAPGHGPTGTIFHTQNGAAYMQPLHGGPPQQIHVSERSDPAALHVMQSWEESHSSESLVKQVCDTAGLAQAAFEKIDSMEKYALVACGHADLYLRILRHGSTYTHKAWDHAAGTALVLAAGGMVSDLNGAPLDFSHGQTLPNRGMIVSNGRIHQRMLAAVQAVFAMS